MYELIHLVSERKVRHFQANNQIFHLINLIIGKNVLTLQMEKPPIPIRGELRDSILYKKDSPLGGWGAWGYAYEDFTCNRIHILCS
jgi:hypothetical protein